MVTVTGFCLAVARLTSREQLSVTLPRVTGYLGTTEVNLDTVTGSTPQSIYRFSGYLGLGRVMSVMPRRLM